MRKKTAAVLEPRQALLDTCTDGVRGIRDRAQLLLAWSDGGRRRSEVVGLSVVMFGHWMPIYLDLHRLQATKTDTSGERRENACVDRLRKRFPLDFKQRRLRLGHCPDGYTKAARSVDTGCRGIWWRESSSVVRISPDLKEIGLRISCVRNLSLKQADRMYPWVK